jgi:transcriptional regulator with XRE-family HTH domain
MTPLKAGAVVRKLRRKADLSLGEPARRTDSSPAFMSQLERDLIAPTVEDLAILGQVLGVNIVDVAAIIG